MRSAIRKFTASKWNVILQIVLILAWATVTKRSDAYYSNYVLIAIASAVCFYFNIKNGDVPFGKSDGRLPDLIVYGFTVIFTLMTGLSNYQVWFFTPLQESFKSTFRVPLNTMFIIIFFGGAFVVFWHIFYAIYKNIDMLFLKKSDKEPRTKNVFLISFLLLVVSRLVILFLCQYPGEFTNDSFTQLGQVMTNEYSDHHPIFHTLLIKVWVTIGCRIFHDMNAAVALYHTFQTVFMALCFSFALSTMERIRAPRWAIVLSLLFYLLMPYHIVFAFTMWKDIMFSGFVLVLITSLFRTMNNIGNKVINIIILAVSGLGTCLFRSNGFFVFVLLVLCVAVMWKLKDKRVLITMGLVIILTFAMKNIVIAALDVQKGDTVEALSIPIQQISRVVTDTNDLKDWERELLSEIIDVGVIKHNYDPHKSDPIKHLLRYYGNQNVIEEKKVDFIKLYLSVGIRHPFKYIYAWVDQTVGYWNSGYDYWRWKISGIDQNNYAIFRVTRCELLNTLFEEYTWPFTFLEMLNPFISIGVFTWLFMVLLMISMLKKDRDGALATLPVLLIVLSLLIATPVHSEFRYEYAAFCAIPMTAVIVLRHRNDAVRDR